MASTGRIIVLLVSLAVLIALILVAPISNVTNWGWDIAVFRAGSKALINGENPYISSNIPRFADGADLASIPYYVYSPIFAVLIAPLALIPPDLAFRVWFLINITLYIASAILIMKSIEWQPSPKGLLGIMLGLALFAPVRTLIILGQSGIIMLFFFSLAYWLLKHDRPVWGGAVMSLAFFKPHLILLLPFFALRRQWKFLGGFLLLSALTTIPFVGLLADWILGLQHARDANVGYGCFNFSSLNMTLQCLLPQTSVGQLIAWILMGALVLATLYFLKEQPHISSLKFDIQIALVICLSLLVIDNIRVADLILLVFPFLISVFWMRTVVDPRRRRVVIGLLSMAYVFPYIASLMDLSNVFWGLPIWYVGIPLSVFISLLLIVSVNRRRINNSNLTA